MQACLVSALSPKSKEQKHNPQTHKQFAFSQKSAFLSMLKDASVAEESMKPLIDEMTKKNIKKRPPPPCPVTSTLPCTEFNEVVVMDVKELKQGTYFLRLVDLVSRLSLVTVISYDEKAATLENKIMTH